MTAGVSELELMGRCRRYRDLLVAHGIEVPDDFGAAAFELAHRRMVAAAVEFMVAAEGLRKAYGSGAELLADCEWRAAA